MELGCDAVADVHRCFPYSTTDSSAAACFFQARAFSVDDLLHRFYDLTRRHHSLHYWFAHSRRKSSLAFSTSLAL
jgi:hypothetical protein